MANSWLKIADVDIGSVESRASTAIFVLICVLPVLSTILYGGVDVITLGLQSLFAASLVVLWIIDANRTEGLRFSDNKLQLAIVGLMIIGLIQLLPVWGPTLAVGALDPTPASSISLDPFATRLFVVRLFVYLIFFGAALAFVDSSRRAKILTAVVIAFGAAVAFFGILQRLAQPDAIYGLRPTPQAIPFGPFVNQHHFAAFMVMTFALSLGILLDRKFRKDLKAFAGLAAGVAMIGLLFTGSRGGALAMGGSVILAVVLSYFVGRERDAKTSTKSLAGAIVLFGVIGILVAGAVIYLGGGDSLQRSLNLTESTVDVTSGRLHFWSVTLQMITNYPIFGVGFDAFGVGYTAFDSLNGTFRIENAHNEYLQVWAEGGLPALACVGAFIFLLFKKGFANIAASSDAPMRGTAVGSLSACFGIAIHSFFDFPLRTPSNALFFLILVVLAVTPFAQVSVPSQRRSLLHKEPQT